MGAKKPAAGKAKAKAKASASAKAEEEAAAAEQNEARRIWQQRKDTTRWAQAQLAALAAQREEAAKDEVGAWAQEPHKWHEAQLANLVKHLEAKRLDVAPDGLKEGVERYVAQCAKGATEEVRVRFREDRDLYAEVPEPEAGAYVRPPNTASDDTAIAQIKAWESAGVEDMEEFVCVVRALPSSPAVQEAALARLGGLLYQFTSETGARKSGAEGLSATCLMTMVNAAMKEHILDPEVQRRGCAVIRGFALMTGQLTPMLEAGGARLAAEAVNAHARHPDVVKTGNAAMEAMAQKAEIGSRDLEMMREAGVHHTRA
mmetsp:Transcript_109917/g.245537  ORF Transcript_109917/g.245537 Transcript_109917/m.245537 type:complete len:316 (-) Transcript_109917:70-1017(-)